MTHYTSVSVTIKHVDKGLVYNVVTNKAGAYDSGPVVLIGLEILVPAEMRKAGTFIVKTGALLVRHASA